MSAACRTGPNLNATDEKAGSADVKSLVRDQGVTEEMLAVWAAIATLHLDTVEHGAS